MSKFNSARAIIDEFIRKNGQGEITGEVMNNVLHSMLDDISVATESDVTKAYVDGKAAEAQAAAEQYIQNEVLTYYATAKYAEGLVNDLEKEIDGRGYLTSSAMDGYATKEDIKGFVTAGTTLAHYGITDAVKNEGNLITPDSSSPAVGFATTANGWPYQGGAMMIGTTGAGQLRLISTSGNGYIPEIFVSGRYLDNESEWARIITDKNIGSNAITIDTNGNTLLPTDTKAKASYVYGGNGWKVAGPAMIFPHGGYSGLFNFGIYNPQTNPNVSPSLFININYGGTLGQWAEVITDKNISNHSIANNSLRDWKPSDPGAKIGYVYGDNGWPTSGAAMSFPKGNYTGLFNFTSRSDKANDLYIAANVGGTVSPWTKVLTEGNIASSTALDSRYLKLTGGTISGTLIIEALESIKGSVPSGGTYPRFRFIQDADGWYIQAATYDGTDRAGSIYFSGMQGVTAKKIQFKATELDFRGTASFQNGITLGNKTIISWDEIAGSGGGNCITSDGGTINAGKYLKFGTSASLGVAATLDNYDKLVVSGLTQMSDLYITEKLYFEKGCTVTFRNWSTNEKETISSFSDLKTLLNLMAAEATIADGGDFNDLTTPGAYTFMSETISNSPTDFGNLLTIRGKSDYYISQLAIKHDGEMYLRTKTDKPGADGDYWTEWRTIVDSASALTMLMGMGQGAVNNGSLNEVTRPGAYTIVGQSLSNYKYQYGTMLAISGTDDYFVSQLAMNASGEVSTRVREGGTWKNWRTLLDESNCGSYCLKAVSSDYYTFLLTSKTTDGVTRFVIQDANQSLLFGAAFWGGNTATIRNYVASRELRISDTLTFGDSTVGFYELMTAKGGAFSGNITCNGGITLGGETINSWANVRSNWGFRIAGLNNQTNVQFDINIRQRTTIVTTLTQDHTVTFNLITEANTLNEWIIVFTTGATVPRINISDSNTTLSWQNKQNILNNLSPNTTYRIHIDSNLAMYETF